MCGEHLLEPVERHVKAVFHHRDMRQEGFGRHAAVDRLRRRGRLHDRAFAGAAAVARPNDPLDAILDRHDVEHFLAALADLVQAAAATRTELVLDVDDDFNARQMWRQLTSVAVGPRLFRLFAAPDVLRSRVLIHGDVRWSQFVLRQQQRQLIEIDFFRAPAKHCSLQLRENEQQLFILLESAVALGDGGVALVRQDFLFGDERADRRRRPFADDSHVDELLPQKLEVRRRIIRKNHNQKLVPLHRGFDGLPLRSA